MRIQWYSGYLNPQYNLFIVKKILSARNGICKNEQLLRLSGNTLNIRNKVPINHKSTQKIFRKNNH